MILANMEAFDYSFVAKKDLAMAKKWFNAPKASTLKWACSTTFEKDSAIQSSHLSQPKYAQFQSVGIKDKLNTRALQLAQLTPPS
jgi:hypothetical protein